MDIIEFIVFLVTVFLLYVFSGKRKQTQEEDQEEFDQLTKEEREFLRAYGLELPPQPPIPSQETSPEPPHQPPITFIEEPVREREPLRHEVAPPMVLDKMPESRVSSLVHGLRSPKDMVILSTVLSRPKSLEP